VPAQEWDRLVRSLGGGFFHPSAWIASRCYDGAAVPWFFIWRDTGDGGVTATAGFYRPSPDRVAGRVIARVHFNCPPARGPADEEILPSVIDWLRGSRSIVGATLGALGARPRWSSRPLLKAVHALEFPIRASQGVPVPASGTARLDQESAQAWRRGDNGRRRPRYECVRRDGERFSRAPALHQSRPGSADRAGKPTHAWRGLLASGHGRLYIAQRDQRVVAGCTFECFGSRAYYLQNAAEEEARRTGATRPILNSSSDLPPGVLSRCL
jgi:hypothetical protein